MRAGTQTLIQALQALPWEDGSGDDESAALPTPVAADTPVGEDSTREG